MASDNDSGAGIPDRAALLETPFGERKLDRELEICELVKTLLPQSGYRRAARYVVDVSPASTHLIYGSRRRDLSYLHVNLASPMRWRDDVYKRGLALSSGSFVFEIVEEHDDGSLIVLAGRQGRDCSARLAYAIARLERGGWQLDWYVLPEKYRTPPPRRDLMEADDYTSALMRRAGQAMEAKFYPKS